MLEFARFLIDSRILTSKDLAEALLFQMQQTPPSITVLYEGGALTADEVVCVLDRQVERSVSLRPACESLGLWKPEFEEMLRSTVKRVRPGLGDVLVERGLMDPQTALRELRRFDQQAAREVTDASAPTSTTAPERPDFHPEFPGQPHEAIEAYLELFTDERRQEIEQAILGLESASDAQTAGDSIDAAYGGYHSVKGGARTVGGVLTQHLVHHAEEAIDFMKRFWAQVPKERLKEVVSVNLEVLDIIWDLRGHLSDAGSEGRFWEDEDKQRHYLALLDRVLSLQDSLSGLGLRVDLNAIESLF